MFSSKALGEVFSFCTSSSSVNFLSIGTGIVMKLRKSLLKNVSRQDCFLQLVTAYILPIPMGNWVLPQWEQLFTPQLFRHEENSNVFFFTLHNFISNILSSILPLTTGTLLP